MQKCLFLFFCKMQSKTRAAACAFSRAPFTYTAFDHTPLALWVFFPFFQILFAIQIYNYVSCGLIFF